VKRDSIKIWRKLTCSDIETIDDLDNVDADDSTGPVERPNVKESKDELYLEELHRKDKHRHKDEVKRNVELNLDELHFTDRHRRKDELKRNDEFNLEEYELCRKGKLRRKDELKFNEEYNCNNENKRSDEHKHKDKHKHKDEHKRKDELSTEVDIHSVACGLLQTNGSMPLKKSDKNNFELKPIEDILPQIVIEFSS